MWTNNFLNLFQVCDKIVDVEVLDDGCIVQKTKCLDCANAPVIKDVCEQQK